MADALALAAQLERDGVGAAIDFFGEQVGDSAAATAAADDYVALADALTHTGSKATVAIDLWHVGLDVSQDFCRAQLERIAAALGGRRLDVGAEDSARTSTTQAIVSLRAGTKGSAVADDPAGEPPPERLRLGLRSSRPAWPSALSRVRTSRRRPTATARRRISPFSAWRESCTRQARTSPSRTHDPILREALIQPEAVSVEMLLGVRTGDIPDLVERGIPVRVYIPYGDGTGSLLDAPHRGIPRAPDRAQTGGEAELPPDTGC